MVYLVPTYKQQLKCVKPTVKTVKQWSLDAVESLLGCFECTDWGVFKEAAADIIEYTETVSEYITFCEGLCIPTKTIKIYHNKKPWFKTIIYLHVCLNSVPASSQVSSQTYLMCPFPNV